MGVIKAVTIFYAFLTVFLFLSVEVTTLSILNVLPALLFMWILYFLFLTGFLTTRKTKSYKSTRAFRISFFDNNKLIVILITILFTILVTRFYTGQTPISIFQNIKIGNSFYAMYQNYFMLNNIGVFRLIKIPYIFMLFSIKFILIYSYISYISISKKLSFYNILYIIIITLAYLYFGLARGTNFELFELVLLIFFVIIKRANDNKIKILSLKIVVIMGIISTIGLSLFFIVVTRRMGSFGYYISSDILWDPNSFISKVSKEGSLLLSGLTMYFGFGFFYFSTFIYKILFSQYDLFMASLIPFGYTILGIKSLGLEVNKFIDPSTNWVPDILALIYHLGIILSFSFVYLIGFFLKKNNLDNDSSSNPLSQMISYILMVQMISFPIGNFVVISSSNKIIVVILFILFLYRKSKIRIRLIKKITDEF